MAFIAKAELFKIPVLSWVLKEVGAFPLVRGGGDAAAVKTAVKVLRSGKALLMFPEGRRVRSGEVSIAKNGFVRLAIMTGASILPIGISGDYRLFSSVRVNVGEAMDLSEYKDQKLSTERLDEMTAEIMGKIYSLAGKDLSDDYEI
jgi:1-acyl-sn-glycerol-3-phosphate acyltransferase